ncbi:MAG: DJ-1/PfpI family protein [Endomicrobium sp.]|jgi:protease I|nr:DJ-1/PfpI family protein [Endomicrobium sp.]
MKQVVFITAPEIFRDEEYAIPKKVLEDAKVKVVTASTKKGEIIGKLGMKAISDITINEINPENFDAIIYVGGAGANIFFKNVTALKLARDFFNSGKPTTAICIAPTILANAGILKGKTATVFADGREDLEKGGANYTGKPLEIDKNIITADGIEAAEIFAKAILNALQKS